MDHQITERSQIIYGNSNSIKLGISSRLLISFLSVFYIGVFLNKHFNLIYGNIPMFSFVWMEIYRIITGIFISDNILEFILNTVLIVTVLNFWENKEGTSKFSIKLALNLIIFQISLLIAFLLFFWIYPIVLSYTIKPLSSIGIAFLVKHLLQTETKFIIMYPRIKINDRFLIIFFLIAFFLINWSEFKFEILFSLYYGFLMCKFPKLFDNAIFDEESILHFEKNENYKFLFHLDSWILIEESYFNSKHLHSSCECENNNPEGNSNSVNSNNEIKKEEKIIFNFNPHPGVEAENLDNQDHIDLSDNCDANLIHSEKAQKEAFEDINLELDS